MSPTTARGRRPDRRLAEREAGDPVLLGLDRGRRGRDDEGRRLRLRPRLRHGRGVDGDARRGRVPERRAARSDRPKEKIEVLALEATVAASVADKAVAFAPLAKRLADHGLARALALLPRGGPRRRRLLAEGGARGRHRRRAAPAAGSSASRSSSPTRARSTRGRSTPRLDRRWSPPGRKSCASGSRTSLPPEAVRIGCSGWNYAHWRERVYPKGLPPARWLEHYATLFDTVEVNSTFYRLPKREPVARLGRADARRLRVRGQGEPLPDAHQAADRSRPAASSASTSASSRSCARRRWARSSGSCRRPSSATTTGSRRARRAPAGPALLRVPPRRAGSCPRSTSSCARTAPRSSSATTRSARSRRTS